MIKEILKAGAWVVFNGRADLTPVVTNALETNGIFQFAAPFVNLQILDTTAEYRPGGAKAVVYGDDIRVWSDDKTVLLFAGFVDRGVQWLPSEGCVRFTAIGYLASLKEMKLGRSRRGGDIYRYRRIVSEPERYTDDEIIDEDWEYIVHPITYETAWVNNPEKQLGYEKVWLFDTVPGRSGQSLFLISEYDQAQYSQVGPDGLDLEDGVFRRKVSDIDVKVVSFSDIVSSIQAQSQAYRDPGEPATHIIYDPDEIMLAWSSAMGTKRYDQIYYTAMTPIDVELIVMFGFKLEREGLPRGDIAVGVITNIDELNVDLTLTRTFRNLKEVHALGDGGAPTWNVDSRGVPTFTRDPLLYHTAGRRNVVHLTSGRVFLYNLWTWAYTWNRYLDIPAETLLETKYVQEGVAEWWDIDITDSHVVNSGTFAFRNVTNDLPDRILSLSPSGGASFSGNDDIETSSDDLSPRQVLNVGRYKYTSASGVPTVASNTVRDSVAISFENASIADVLLEICKLTNSVLFVDVDSDGRKTIYLVRRDYSVMEWDLRGTHYQILSKTQMIDSRIGERIPEISSAIISNAAFNRALSAFYNDTFLPAEEEIWNLTLAENNYTASIKVMDAVRIEETLTGDPLIIRNLSIGGGVVQLTAARGR